MKRLFECQVDHSPDVTRGVEFIPFIPKPGDICTLLKVDVGRGYLFEEVQGIEDGKNCAFRMKYWREITGEIPSSEEISEWVEELQLVTINQ